MRLWRDSRHPIEKAADDRYAAVRAGEVGITQAVAYAADRITAYRVVTYNQGKRMSKLAEISERIVEKKAAHDAKADEWAARLDELDRREPVAFAIGDAVIEEKEGDVAEMERNMRTISNLPLAGSVK